MKDRALLIFMIAVLVSVFSAAAAVAFNAVEENAIYFPV